MKCSCTCTCPKGETLRSGDHTALQVQALHGLLVTVVSLAGRDSLAREDGIPKRILLQRQSLSSPSSCHATGRSFQFGDVRQLHLDSKAPQYFKPYSRQYPAMDSFTSDGKLFNATLGGRHPLAPALVRTLQVMPEWVTPKLYWVVGTKDALSSFPAAAKPFADKLTAAKLAENCPVKSFGPLVCQSGSRCPGRRGTCLQSLSSMSCCWIIENMPLQSLLELNP